MDQISGVIDAELERDKEFFWNLTEKHLIQKNILAKIVPIVIEVIKETIEKFKRIEEEKSATYLERVSVLSFCKFLLVSEEFCKEHIHYLFDLLELKGLDSKVKGNILIAIGDLYKRFTNTLESHN